MYGAKEIHKTIIYVEPFFDVTNNYPKVFTLNPSPPETNLFESKHTHCNCDRQGRTTPRFIISEKGS